MVERLKAAIEKARQQRQAAGAEPASDPTARRPAVSSALETDRHLWRTIPELALDADTLAQNRIVSFSRSDPAFVGFDLLRTRLIKTCSDNGWHRIGITSASRGCGKSLVSVNLAFSFARHSGAHMLLVDLDLRAPALAHHLGVKTDIRLAKFLSGEIEDEAVLQRFGDRLLVALNAGREREASELLQSAVARQALSGLIARFSPTIVLFDLPPMLVSDDVLGFLPQLDAIILVVAAGQTTAAEIKECTQLLGDTAHFLGVVLNKTEGVSSGQYLYDE